MIRSATPSDVPVILSLIKALAAFEREPDAVVATVEDLQEALFGADAVAGCSLAEVDGAVVGFALWYRTFSTWQGKPGLWLEDLFVLPAARGTGLGRALLVSLAQLAVERGWTRFEWWVLDCTRDTTPLSVERATGSPSPCRRLGRPCRSSRRSCRRPARR